ERKHEVDRAHCDQDIRDQLGSLGIRGRVGAPFLDVELAAEASRQCGEEARAISFSRPDLEVRSPRPAERPGAEQRAAEVGGGAATPGDDPAGRTAERAMGTVEYPGPVQGRVSVVRALHVQLVA